MRWRWLFFVPLAGFSLGLGGSPYRWERPIELPSAAAGWCALDLPDDVLTAVRPGLADLRVVAAGEEVAYTLESRLRPSKDTERLRDVERAESETTAIVDRGPKARASGAIELEVAGSEPFLKPVIVEASDDRSAWREIARGSVFRTERTTMTALRFAPSDRRYLRLRFDDHNGPAIRPEAVVVAETPVDVVPGKQVDLSVTRSPATETGSSIYIVELPSEHLPLVALELAVRDAAFERPVRVYEQVLFRDEVSRRLVGAGTIWRAADGRASMSLGLGDVSSRTLEVEVDDGGSPALDVTGASARLEHKRIVFFVHDGMKPSLRYGSATSFAPRYDLDAALARGRPVALCEARVGLAVDRGSPPTEVPPPPRGPRVEPTQWATQRPIALPALGSVAYLDLEPDDLQDVRIIDERNDQVPYVFEQGERHVRRNVAFMAAEHGQTTEVTLAGSDVPRADRLELSANAPDYFERSVVVLQDVFDRRGVTEQREIGSAVWRKEPGKPAVVRISLAQSTAPTLVAKIDNQDNPPLALGPAVLEVAFRRVDFAFRAGDQLRLLKGNAASRPPRYDLALLAGAVISSPAQPATLGPVVARPAHAGLAAGWFWGASIISGAILLLTLLRALKPEAR
jgi:hypothetical protein